MYKFIEKRLIQKSTQAFFIEYWVHWRWNRFHLSFDSVVKYFACGFLLTTPMAIAFEAVISTLTGLIVMVISVFVIASDDDMADEVVSRDKRTMKDFMVKHQAVFVFAIFLNAFLVAAMVEEMVKYFGYWMVVVPDLLPKNNRQQDSDTENEDGINEANQDDRVNNRNGNATERHTSAKSTGIGITVAMVSVALGFACCENIMYVFVHSPPSLGVGKIATRVIISLYRPSRLISTVIPHFSRLCLKKYQLLLRDLCFRCTLYVPPFRVLECVRETSKETESMDSGALFHRQCCFMVLLILYSCYRHICSKWKRLRKVTMMTIPRRNQHKRRPLRTYWQNFQR